MNEEMSYQFTPTHYVTSLQKIGKREKARAFFEYFFDMQRGNENSVSFYATSWRISKATSGRWIQEFKDEIHKFLELWNTKNDQKSVRRFCERDETINTSKISANRELQKNNETICKNERDEVIILKDDDNAHTRESDYDKSFEKLFMMARRFYKHIGKRETAYQEYKRLYPHIQPQDMAYAYALHVKDPQNFKKPFNLANFMHNDAYISYLALRLIIQIQGKEPLKGWYNKEAELLHTGDDTLILTKERFSELLCKGDIQILPQMKIPGQYK